MKIKEQTRKLAAGCSKQCFEHSMEIEKQTRKLAAGCSKHCFEGCG
ncbi:hypothetical protein [Streptococcus pneumoniae]|nr:hypothetical protein [Streptococcus pneumoniae]